MDLLAIQKKIEQKSLKLGVIGLGYVGLPVAAMFAEAGFDVLGIDVKQDRVDKINAGESPIEGNEPGLSELLSGLPKTGRFRASTKYTELSDREIVLIDVETPVDDTHIPRYEALKKTLESLGPVLLPGALVIIESTIAPGTIQKVVLPLLEQYSDRKVNEGFYLGNCPERVMPGKLLYNLRHLSRVVGGMTPQTSAMMVKLYQNIVKADLDPTDCITAELVKTVENAYRDVQIAFANEVALICDYIGADAWKVRELVNKSPQRNMHLPGAGVGGHCIPKDPWLMVYSVRDTDVPVRIVPAARDVNNSMPLHMVRLTEAGLRSCGKELSGSKILVMGYAYLENSDDTRNSPSIPLIDAFKKAGAEIVIQDPYVKEYNNDFFSLAQGADALVIMVAHLDYKSLDLRRVCSLMRTPLMVDGRALFQQDQVAEMGFQYIALGKGNIFPSRPDKPG
jgi:UDP-N-acetyl-D-mannosaminuronic acid dehydrogenase